MSLKPAIGQADHKQGGHKASIEIVEYGDYQCPYCGAAYPILKQIEDTFGDQILFVFRNFPLQEAHRFAMVAAQAAEAAARQDKFWEMHDAIFENQQQLSDAYLFSLAEQIGLDVDQFQIDLEAESTVKKVEDDFESGVRSGVNGTPSFFVNGQKFDGGAEDLMAMLKESTQ
ncbi:DsbA family protein [Pedobacter metabolipauper]|uniref:Thioredoxin-like protein n=1 Tax=Pedobacter metabolipauper TaxID=425513 RepID=A0A4R6T167_9SPHI|nr:thioredoxin domain-containing protein [Pedobacter metabolipauper]TDQ11799.1 thioredoxin-like protein [Pedobacter metabolipauper]